MRNRRSWFAGALSFLALLPGGNRFAVPSMPSLAAASPQSTLPSQMFRYVKELGRLFAIEHTARWKHSVPEFGDVTKVLELLQVHAGTRLWLC